MECKCPYCGGEIHLSEVVRAPAETTMRFSLTPKPGEFISAETVGGTLGSLEKLLRAVGKSLGAKTFVGVQGVAMEGGAIHFDLRIANAPPGFRDAVASASR